MAKQRIDISNLQLGAKVRYGFYSNLVYDGTNDNDDVVLKDGSGNLMVVYRSLFEKHAELLD